jgi:non-lysosomal glucosylceramidase
MRPKIILAFALILGLAVDLGLAAAAGGQDQMSAYPAQELLRLGHQRAFEGPSLKEIAFPLGGIGTGTVSLGGRGNLRDWEIFNRPDKGVNLPFTFFALYFEEEGRKPLVRVLEGPLAPPFTGEDGIPRAEVPGLPRMETARFIGEYPFARVELSDRKIPLRITLEAFNPFIPLKPEESGIPAVVFRYRIKNLGPRPVKITVAGSILNPVGFDGVGTIDSVGHPKLGGNVNRVRKEGGLSGLLLSSQKVKPESPSLGTVALTTTWKDITYLSHWVRGDWWDDLQIFWDDFRQDGRLKDLDDPSPSPDGRTDIGTLGLAASLAPFEEVELPFILSWNFPNVLNYFDIIPARRGSILKNHYAARFADAWTAADHLARNLQPLEKETRKFKDAFFGSTLPAFVLDAVSSQAATIRTPACFWLADGSFFGFEGCNNQSGCCPLNCSHVWNYAQSLAFLFPSLERSMRETDFLNNLKPDGAMAFRTSLPLDSKALWDFRPAADGQMGRVINFYRDWQISGDTAFLKKLWPSVRKSLEYAWVQWDADRDGLLEGEQHNTYDIEFVGPNSMLSGFYLGALLAGRRMAEAVGDADAARAFGDVFDKGRRKYEEILWNGEYYVQKYDKALETKYQYGEGCLSDQLLGQWLGMVAGLGRFLPDDHVKTALGSIYRYNFLTDFSELSNAQRTYALNDEKGLLACTWPKGGRPPLPFPYSDEVWTGIEYQVASHLIYEGRLFEGLSIVKAARDRYDGRRRNPWDELECGHHYVRAMSSWGLLLALSGVEYSAPEMRMGFAPSVYPDDFRGFWCVGSGWGEYYQKAADKVQWAVGLKVVSGGLSLKEFSFTLPAPAGALRVTIGAGPSSLKAEVKVAGGRVTVSWSNPVVLKAGEDLRFDVKLQ